MNYMQKVASLSLTLRNATENERPTLIAGIRVSVIARLAPLIVRCAKAENIRRPHAGWQLMDNDEAVAFFLDNAFFPNRPPFVFAPPSELEVDALKLLIACVRFEERRQLPDGSYLHPSNWKGHKRAPAFAKRARSETALISA